MGRGSLREEGGDRRKSRWEREGERHTLHKLIVDTRCESVYSMNCYSTEVCTCRVNIHYCYYICTAAASPLAPNFSKFPEMWNSVRVYHLLFLIFHKVADFGDTYMNYLGGRAPRLQQGCSLLSRKWNQKYFIVIAVLANWVQPTTNQVKRISLKFHSNPKGMKPVPVKAYWCASVHMGDMAVRLRV